MWYGNETTNRHAVIANNCREALKLMTHIQHLNLTLHNILRAFTNFPRASKYGDTIPDLTFTRRHTTSITGNSSSDPDMSGDSDHLLISLTLDIKNPTVTPTRVNRLTDWEKFDQVIQDIQTSEGT